MPSEMGRPFPQPSWLRRPAQGAGALCQPRNLPPGFQCPQGDMSSLLPVQTGFIFLPLHIHMHMYNHAHAYSCTHKHVHAHSKSHAYIAIRTHLCAHAHAPPIHIHAYTHEHTRTGYTLLGRPWLQGCLGTTHSSLQSLQEVWTLSGPGPPCWKGLRSHL